MNVEEEIDRLNTTAEENFRQWLASAGMPSDLPPDPRQPLTPEEVRELTARRPPPLPEEMDAAIERIVAAFVAADDPLRDAWRERINTHSRRHLLRFASDMATAAVKLNSAHSIQLGLAAMAMEGGHPVYRERLLPIVKLYHSAVKLNLDTTLLFAWAAALALPGHLRNALKRFPSRPEGQRRLAAFYLREVGTQEDFHYENVPWPETEESQIP
jgi:hypothetical protein